MSLETSGRVHHRARASAHTAASPAENSPRQNRITILWGLGAGVLAFLLLVLRSDLLLYLILAIFAHGLYKGWSVFVSYLRIGLQACFLTFLLTGIPFLAVFVFTQFSKQISLTYGSASLLSGLVVMFLASVPLIFYYSTILYGWETANLRQPVNLWMPVFVVAVLLCALSVLFFLLENSEWFRAAILALTLVLPLFPPFWWKKVRA